MIATTKIKMDLTGLRRQPCVDVMQDDQYSRNLEISLFTGGVKYVLPEDCGVLVRCRKPDGRVAVYDTLPDGTAACSVAENMVTVRLAPQVCTAAGKAELTVTLLHENTQLSSFAVALQVHPQPKGVAESEKYVNITAFLPQPESAEVGQYLRVAEVRNGKVTAVRTAAVPVGGATSEVSGAPDYVLAEAERVAEAVQNRQNADTLTLIACSDPHYSGVHTEAGQMAQSVNHCGQAIRALREKVHVDLLAMLGDLIWDGGEDPRQAMDAMRFVNTALAGGSENLPNLRARGNHDCLCGSDTGLTDSQIFAGIGAYNSGAVFDPENRVGGYCYRDFEDQKIRVVCINTCEASDGSFAVSDRQISWLKTALELSSLGDGWGSVLLSHHPLDWYGSGQAVVQTVAAAEGVLCAIHGHVHNYKVDTVAGTDIPRIAVPNVCFYRNNEYGQNGGAENSQGIEFGEEVTYGKTAGTAEDTAFCVITLDRGSGRVYADHYGAGYSRVVSLNGEALAVYSVSCALTNVTVSTLPGEMTQGAAFAARLTADDQSTLQSVAVTMGGADVTDEAYAAGVVRIPAVTGDIVITAVAQKDGTVDESPSGEVTDNLVPTSIDTDGSIYNGVGYQQGYRLNSSGSTSVLEGAIVSGYIPYAGEIICIGGSAAATAGTVGNYISLYDSSFNWLNSLGFDNLNAYGASWSQSGDQYQLTVDPAALSNTTAQEQLAAAAYLRCSLGAVAQAEDFTVTLNGSV